jgi:ABC-type transport system involved in multi-copper enzyme maturation permease subunit
MFAMTFERDPMRLQDVPAELISWIQIAGGWAAFGALVWLLLGYRRMREEDRARIPSWQRSVFLGGLVVAAIGYVLTGAILAVALATSDTSTLAFIRWVSLTVASAGALVAVGLPFFANLQTLRFRRIFALAKLSFKEAIRSRVLYAFSFLLVLFLFGSWFIPHKPEDEVRSYVGVVYWVMKVLLLVAAVVLTAFSLPKDIRQQTIHTIITKPVERFEIILGRFLGFASLMTLVLLIMTTLSVLYVLRSIDPEAAEETLKAREPLYGELRYENTSDTNKATNVGREWDYRSYITAVAPNQPPQYAVWDFASIPGSLANRKTVRCEFTFDIYRTTKGFENRGVSCEFQFQTANFDKTQRDKYNEARSRLLAQPNRPPDADIDNQFAEEYGFYIVPAKDITDYHTQHIDVPAGLFRNALQSQSAARSAKGGGETTPPLQVRVRCRSQTQYVGMAKYDFYWRLDDPQSGGQKLAFALNFYKGIFGMWLILCLVVGLAVALSTYLSGVITLLLVAMLYLGGVTRPFIASLAEGSAAGGGPMEALVRLSTRQVALIPLEESTAAKVATTSDYGFRGFMYVILHLIPDVDRYDLTNYVSDGFNIPLTQLLLDGGALVLYLLPWIILAYYLIKWREIAAPT